MRFTSTELKEIAEAHKAVCEAIRPNFGTQSSSHYKDSRAAGVAAARIVAAKIFPDSRR